MSLGRFKREIALFGVIGLVVCVMLAVLALLLHGGREARVAMPRRVDVPGGAPNPHTESPALAEAQRREKELLKKEGVLLNLLQAGEKETAKRGGGEGTKKAEKATQALLIPIREGAAKEETIMSPAERLAQAERAFWWRMYWERGQRVEWRKPVLFGGFAVQMPFPKENTKEKSASSGVPVRRIASGGSGRIVSGGRRMRFRPYCLFGGEVMQNALVIQGQKSLLRFRVIEPNNCAGVPVGSVVVGEATVNPARMRAIVRLTRLITPSGKVIPVRGRVYGVDGVEGIASRVKRYDRALFLVRALERAFSAGLRASREDTETVTGYEWGSVTVKQKSEDRLKEALKEGGATFFDVVSGLPERELSKKPAYVVEVDEGLPVRIMLEENGNG
ncbi:conjugative transposon protein TraM [Thermosulfurimonas sp. F29]|uniref:conjugative transposon protein TraM n=1 Tax=Thermosulfurimonas sp. F29 TaxID=2867247 RepID=UPI001C82A4E2|nr:conjugative transposon protein TraM [Thermosulfurimonas sp. F29]MBX6424204.1 conjugative transposon protein TraM [Thermosulfurimonas sp. F29]